MCLSCETLFVAIYIWRIKCTTYKSCLLRNHSKGPRSIQRPAIMKFDTFGIVICNKADYLQAKLCITCGNIEFFAV